MSPWLSAVPACSAERSATALQRRERTLSWAGRSQERGVARVTEIREAGGTAQFVAVDVTSRDSFGALRDSVHREHGRVDILVNCAG